VFCLFIQEVIIFEIHPRLSQTVRKRTITYMLLSVKVAKVQLLQLVSGTSST